MIIKQRAGFRALRSLTNIGGICVFTFACSSGQTGDAGLGAGAIETDHDPDAGAQAVPTETPSPPPTNGVSNPTGECVPRDNGARAHDHSPESTDTYLPDCRLDLDREYFRVFEQADGTAYMIPRPDGHGAWATPCSDASHALNDVVLRYRLCESPGTEETVMAVNAMTPEDALSLAHYLHEQLVFYPVQDAVAPWPFNADILEACKTNEALLEGPLAERCRAEIAAQDEPARDEPGVSFSPEEAAALATALNDLYGIGDRVCKRLSDSARVELQGTIDASRACSSDDECVVVSRSSNCHDSCTDVASQSLVADIDATRQLIDGAQCVAFERAECTFLTPPCDPGSGALRCVEGQCASDAEPVTSPLSAELTTPGGCANVILFATNADASVVLFVQAEGLLDDLTESSPETEFEFELPDAAITVQLERGSYVGGQCTDIANGDYRLDETLTATSGTARIVVRPLGSEFSADLILENVELSSDTDSLKLEYFDLNDIRVGWFAG